MAQSKHKEAEYAVVLRYPSPEWHAAERQYRSHIQRRYREAVTKDKEETLN